MLDVMHAVELTEQLSVEERDGVVEADPVTTDALREALVLADSVPIEAVMVDEAVTVCDAMAEVVMVCVWRTDGDALSVSAVDGVLRAEAVAVLEAAGEVVAALVFVAGTSRLIVCAPLSATYSTWDVASYSRPAGFKKPASTPAATFPPAAATVVPVPPWAEHAPARVLTWVTKEALEAMVAKRTEPHVEDEKYTP